MKDKYLFYSLPIAMTLMLIMAMTSEKEMYELFSAKGKEVSYEKILKQAEESDIVFVGELHDNPVSHWIETELALDLAKSKGKDLIMGAEMFEADQQEMLNEYCTKLITKKQFDEQARLWKNYQTDYSPFLEVAVENGLKFIATNIPRRYAAIVSSNGFEGLDSLSSQAKSWIAPLPILYPDSLKCYKEMLAMMGMHNTKSVQNLPKAQALKDATMAYFINKNYQKGATFLHFNGSYHSDNYEGIVWYLKKINPDLKIMTISTVEQDDASKLDSINERIADYIIVTNSRIIKTN